MSTAFEVLRQQLKQLPGLGFRSSERLALHLLVEKPDRLPALVEALQTAARTVRRCEQCGNVAEDARCTICSDDRRDAGFVCVVEHIPDLAALERSGAHAGVYHVLHGKLSPIRGVTPTDLNFEPLLKRVRQGAIHELILALSNDVEGEATCHYLTAQLPTDSTVKVSRIGFGLPSGGGVLYADSITLKSALDSRRAYQ